MPRAGVVVGASPSSLLTTPPSPPLLRSPERPSTDPEQTRLPHPHVLPAVSALPRPWTAPERAARIGPAGSSSLVETTEPQHGALGTGGGPALGEVTPWPSELSVVGCVTLRPHHFCGGDGDVPHGAR